MDGNEDSTAVIVGATVGGIVLLLGVIIATFIVFYIIGKRPSQKR